ncbi:hypothetical protein GCM10009544_00470 [Streptomyces stramineus]|uniref:Uncharacterized protein n=1 Tax=Streptomyces stramineus TaxID=173861 RepID=A0ABP3J4X7_9ACTN
MERIPAPEPGQSRDPRSSSAASRRIGETKPIHAYNTLPALCHKGDPAALELRDLYARAPWPPHPHRARLTEARVVRGRSTPWERSAT